MNRILIKIVALVFIFGITSCTYEPIFLEKNYSFEIENTFFTGEKKINRIIENKLKFIRSAEGSNKNKYVLNIDSEKKRTILSKDSKGDPLKFEMIILVKYELMKNGEILINNTIKKNNIYNNEADQFKLEQNEEIILENISSSISDNIISSIINLNDN
tara:strand:- start:1296 stop:1772 length:477 start_codon:yes stop_codon:yes gene_type:complete